MRATAEERRARQTRLAEDWRANRPYTDGGEKMSRATEGREHPHTAPVAGIASGDEGVVVALTDGTVFQLGYDTDTGFRWDRLPPVPGTEAELRLVEAGVKPRK